MNNITQITFNPLTPQQIEVRPTNTKYKGKASLLLYIDSRAAAEILDDTFGPFNWQIEYKPINDKIYGRLSIFNPITNQWIAKEDTGSESNIEADKGQASDILKRCLARWGCNFLYSAPDITIKCPDSYYYNDKLSMSFKVKEIEYEGKKISKLIIVDKFNNEVFNWNNKTLNNTPNNSQNNTVNTTNIIPTTDNLTILRTFCSEKKNEKGVDNQKLMKFWEHYNYKIVNNLWKGTMQPDVLFNKFTIS